MEIKGSLIAKSIIEAGLRVNEGLSTLSILADTALTKYSKKHQYLYLDDDHVVSLPNAQTLPNGWTISIYNKDASHGNILLKDYTNNSFKPIKPKRMRTLTLVDNSTPDGVWKAAESGGSGGDGGSGLLRNVIIKATGTVISASGMTATVGNFVGTISSGFEDDGSPIDTQVVKASTENITISQSQYNYLYMDADETIWKSSYKQIGGVQLPAYTTYPVGTMYYCIEDAVNYERTANGWEEHPCVAIGEIDPTLTATVYPMNFWWWYPGNEYSLTSYSQTFYNTATQTNSITLSYPVYDTNSLFIIVGNTLLLKETYTVAANNKTILFDTPIEPGIKIEARCCVQYETTGNTRTIGEIYFSQSDSVSDNAGALPLFTGELISNADEAYSQFYNWVLSHTGLCKTEAQYQDLLSQYGECPFYVIDDENKTLRLPKLAKYIKMANTTDGITQSAAGLPNITGSIDASGSPAQSQVFGETHESSTTISGAFQGIFGGQDATVDASGESMLRGFTFDASRSNSEYGNANTVTPAHTTLFPWVVAYTAAIPVSIANAAEFQDTLSNKADRNLANVSNENNSAANALNSVGIRTVVETYTNGSSWYRVWSDGWCEQGGELSNSGTDTKQITFLKAFTDTNYYFNRCNESTVTGTSTSFANEGYTDKQTSGIKVYCYSSITKCIWEAKGYIV